MGEPDPLRLTIHTADWWGSVDSSADAAYILSGLAIGRTATVFKEGAPNNEPSCSCTVSRVADGWVVHAEASEAPWVAVLRQLLTSGTAQPEGGTP
jgi:hypothetical protein